MAALLLSTLQRVEQAKIQYCVLRDADQINNQEAIDEVDLLVAGRQLQQLQQLLTRLGFVALPSWGYGPHHFFVGYDQASDSWLKLDVVTAVAFGYPYHTMYTTLAIDCLAQRQKQGHIFIPMAELEMILLLFHCIVDKKRFEPHRRERVKALRNAIQQESYIASLLQEHELSTVDWQQLAMLIDNANWEGLLALRKTIIGQLAHKQQLLVEVRAGQQRLLRKFNHWLQARRPRSLTVAILAPDGAGKSTVVTGVQETFYFPVHTIYMGLYQKGEATKSATAMLGASLLRRLATQWQRYLVARYQQARRKLVLFDRYTYDTALPSETPLTRSQQWRRWLLAHACPAPDLVIILDAPGAVLYARKGEHSVELLEKRRQSYLHLQAEVPQTVVVDATQDRDMVRRAVIQIIWSGYLLRQTGQSVSRIKNQLQARYATDSVLS